MLHVLLMHLPPRCALTFFPAPEGQAVKRLRTPPSEVLKEQRYMIWKEGSQNKLQVEKSSESYIFPNYISLFFEHRGGRCSQAFDCLPFGSGEKCQSAPRREVRQEYV